MKTIFLKLAIVLLLFKTSFSQGQISGTEVQFSFGSFVQLEPNKFQFDAYITNAGTTSISLRAYSFGLNLNSLFANGGTLSSTYISRSASFANLPLPTTQISPLSNGPHLRLTTTTGSIANAVTLASGVAYRLATIQVQTSACIFVWQSNPFAALSAGLTPIQLNTSSGRTSCLATCQINGSTYTLFNTTIGPAVPGSLVTGIISPDPNGFAPFTLTIPEYYIFNSVTACDAYTWPVSGVTYTNSGNYAYTVCSTPNGSAVRYLTLTITNSNSEALSYTTNDSSWVIKLFIEGLYTGSHQMINSLQNAGIGNDSSLSDSVTIQLRSPNSPHNIITTQTVAIRTNGIAIAKFPLYLNGNYYIVVKHRNAIETWSASPVLRSPCVSFYDFTTAVNKAYGSNMIQVEPNVWAIYSGDINHDDNIDLLDLSILESDLSAFQFGYISTDLNGDVNADLLDVSTLEPNINNFIFSSHP